MSGTNRNHFKAVFSENLRKKRVARIAAAVTANRDVAVAVAVKSLTATLIFINVEQQCFEI